MIKMTGKIIDTVIQGKIIRSARRQAAALLLSVVLLIIFSPASLCAQTALNAQLFDGFEVGLEPAAAAAVDLQSRSLLYEEERKTTIPFTTANRLMLFLLVAESTDPATQITLGAEAVALDKDFNSPDGVRLQNGQRVSVEYLLYRLLFYDSETAKAALSQHLEPDQHALLTLMKARAENLELAQTTFEQSEDRSHLPGSALTSANDLLRLLMACLNNNTARSFLLQTETFVQISQDEQRIVAMRSPLYRLRALSEDRIKGVFYLSDSQYSAAFAYGRSRDNIDIAQIVITQPGGDLLENESLTLWNALDDYYTQTVLTEKGDKVPSITETAENGETFGLVYLETVHYLHPRHESFLRQTIEYEGRPPYRLPLQPDVATGAILFELMNSYQIRVPVGPDRAIISDNSTFARLLLSIQNNPNLGMLLLGAIGTLFLLLLFGIMRNILRTIYYLRQVRSIRRGVRRRER
jgi:D-alanyl-D-alanine carboxypeptidase